MMTIRIFLPVLLLGAVCFLGLQAQNPSASGTKPLKALLIAGGCCHDYKAQHEILFKGIQARANVQVDVVWTDDKSVDPPLPLYDNPDWAKGYDVVIHDECAAGNKDLKVMKHILDAHQTIPAVHLHCAMHSFRNGTDQWFQHIGLKSSSHGPQKPIKIEFVEKDHPIVKGLEDWTTGNEELYNNLEILDAQPLALGRQMVPRKDQPDEEAVSVVVWTNEKQGAPSFSTSIGHNNFTVEDPRYLDLVTRGLLWTCGKLNDDYLGKPFTGENKISFVPAKPKEEPKTPTLGPAPQDATLTIATASSEEGDKHNYAWRAIDGDQNTRWCASNGSLPQWLQLELDKPHQLTGAHITWEGQGTYQHTIEVSADGKTWQMAFDASSDAKPGDSNDVFEAKDVKWVRITCTGTGTGSWASIREVKLLGPAIKSLFPKLADAQKKQVENLKQAANDPYAKQGNIPPKIVKLSEKEEKEILNQVKVPEGFDVSVFSSWQAANYPVYVTASPEGDLYVASDGNGSLGRDPGRGRIIRLRDTDGDGRADQLTEFVKDLDSPRGMVWDQDRLFVLHPPHITVFYDQDGDGVSEANQRLIDGIAFGFADRPADHTTNGLDMGIDGWIYVAGGDFGFKEAKGSDGRVLQHRAGGVIRFRPDGSGLEIFATGTRNILGTPISPLLDIFARDNTNDGGGWNVRFHHFFGLGDHGYPRLYKNFPGEHIEPLADYGGGSGCGSVYLAEPGFPPHWNNAPLTCDWGTGGLWKHTVERIGGTFRETAPPEKLISLPRPTDADVDGKSAIYQASWKGPATFNWKGPDQGFIVKVTPTGYQPEPLPDFKSLSDGDLIELLATTESQVRRIAAQRTLLRRDVSPAITDLLLSVAADGTRPLPGRIAALFALSQQGISSKKSESVIAQIQPLAADAELAPFVIRALGDMALDRLTSDENGPVPAEILKNALVSSNERTRLEALVTAARQNCRDVNREMAALLGEGDPAVAHTAFQTLAMLDAHEACFAVLLSNTASSSQRTGAGFALMRMHHPDVVTHCLNALTLEKRPEVREVLFAILARLHHREAPWNGSSWGTRPDTRGPYYEPVTWEESDRILSALKNILGAAESQEAAFLVKEMNRNRIHSNEALQKIISMAHQDAAFLPEAVAQISASNADSPEGTQLLIQAAKDSASTPATLSQSLVGLARSDHPDALAAMLKALASLDKAKGADKEQKVGQAAFLSAPKLENHHLAIEKLAAENLTSPENAWANAALVELASRKKGSPESRQMSQKAIDRAWQNREQKLALLRAAAQIQNHHLDDRILAALGDPDKAIAETASKAAQRLKLQLPGEDKSPKIMSLKPEDAIAQATAMKGDPALGEAVYSRATCAACHTVSEDEKQRGPYLGNIAQTYNRLQLAEAIIQPNKTIAQGFKTNVITLKDGRVQAGFVTDEAGDTVTMRDIAANELTFAKSDISQRDTLPISMMPEGLVNGLSVREVASLLDYLVKLSPKK